MDEGERDRAVQRAAHQIAACVHGMLAETRVTTLELKKRLSDLEPDNRFDPATSNELVEGLLSARLTDRITIDFLTKVGLVLGYDWDFRIVRSNLLSQD